MAIVAEVARLIYGTKDGDVFVIDKGTKKTRLAPKYLARLNEYQILKKLVVSTCDKVFSKVDVDLLLSYIEQLRQKQQIFLTQRHYGLLRDTRSHNQICEDTIYELAVMRPTAIKQSL